MATEQNLILTHSDEFTKYVKHLRDAVHVNFHWSLVSLSPHFSFPDPPIVLQYIYPYAIIAVNLVKCSFNSIRAY